MTVRGRGSVVRTAPVATSTSTSSFWTPAPAGCDVTVAIVRSSTHDHWLRVDRTTRLGFAPGATTYTSPLSAYPRTPDPLGAQAPTAYQFSVSSITRPGNAPSASTSTRRRAFRSVFGSGAAARR